LTAVSVAESSHFLSRLAALVLAIVLGQGAILLVQTLLVLQGRYNITAALGFGLALLSLAQWIADWGGMALLTRLTVRSAQYVSLSEAILARLLVSVPTAMAQIAFSATHYADDPIASGILVGGAVTGPFWALNITGFLDGHARGAHVGPVVGLPWLMAGVLCYGSLTFGPAMSDKTVGLLIGAAFSLGCLICVLAQHRFASRMAMGYRLEAPTRRGTLRYLTDGGLYCLGELPSQLYSRALLVLVNENADAKTTGVYVYIRQVISAVAQCLAVIKRLELIKLSLMVSQHRITFRNVLQSQALNIAAAILFFLGAIALANLDVSLPSSRGAAVHSGTLTLYLAYFAAAVPAWAVSAAFGQIVLLLGQIRMYSLIVLTTVGLSALGSLLLMPRFGLEALAVIDSSMFVIQATMFWLVVQRFRRRLP
jgi:hypothetical protein